MKQHCGIATLLGESNAGKSSLLNAFAQAAFAEVHRKRNMTREVMRAVITIDQRQLVLEDTAGLNAEAHDTIGTRRKERALDAARHADLVVWIVDAARGARAVQALLKQASEQRARQISEEKMSEGKMSESEETGNREENAVLSPSSSRCFVALNKIDLVKDKRRLLPLASRLGASGLFRDVLMLSAKSGFGIETAREALLHALPEEGFLYTSDGDTRSPARLACETIRATLYECLHDELPYDALVESERCEQREGAWHIALTIQLRRESQRRILLLRDGRLLQTVRRRASDALQRRFSSPVFLQLHVPRPR